MTDLFDLVVADRRQEASDVVSLTLRSPDGRPLAAWEPGAHIDLVLADGLERQYSLCGGDTYSWRIAVLREPEGRGGSEFVHTTLRPGARVRARGPRNHFPLEVAPAYRFVAGGIGITPILPMLDAASPAPWTLLYGGRSRSTMAFTEELTSRHPSGRILLHEGHLDLRGHLADLRPGELVYACGPASLLEAVESLVPMESLRTERFTPRVSDDAADAGFEVELAQSGRILTVSTGESILTALLAAGVEVPYSCTEGICGTCETRILAGGADHRDSILTPQEQATSQTLMICVSRSRTPRLTLDL
ncbi:PDR/VanB family oxidoreductase [Streptomyces sp. NPDC013157]|uniref:PDR/VanB family oxidoreductase n=1 Tax=Streptomyces sp. NPDC013157 TaxID=3364861 RepID=UPI00367EFAD3